MLDKKPREGFNAGITTRSALMPAVGGRADDGTGDSSYMSTANSRVMAAGTLESGSGRNSPARTREAFMPYGYGYARSESRLANRTDDVGGRKSPMARGGTPVGELEKGVGMKEAGMGAETPESAPAKQKKRVLVRERSMQGSESPEAEKSHR